LNGIAGQSISLDKGSGDVNVELTAQITGRCGDGCPGCIKAVKLALLNPAGERVKDKCHAEHSGSSCDFKNFYDIYSIDTNLVGQWQVNVEGRWASCSDGLDNYGPIAFINVEDNSVPTVSPSPSDAPSTSRPTEAPSTLAPNISLSPTGAVLQFDDISAKSVALNGIAGQSISLDKGSGDVNVELTAQITGRCGDGCPGCIKAVKLALLNPAGERVKDKCHAEHSGSSCDFKNFYDIYSIDTNLVGQWQVNVEGRWASCSDGLDNYGPIAFINVEDNSVPTVSPLQCDDSTSNFAISGGTLGCPFVSRDIEQYCAVSVPSNVKSHCPETCSACAEYGCEDSEAEFTFESPSGFAVIMSCSMIPSYKVTSACELWPIRNTCRRTCEYCEA